MKKYFALISLAAMVSLVSCNREELAPSEGTPSLKGKTVLTISTGETKTTMGEVSGGKRPVYWANGDKVAVNGVVSEPLADLEANSASASFTFASVIDPPFNAVYPETIWKDDLSVKLPQQATSGILPLVGYGDAESLTVKPLTAAVKLSVKKYSGENPDLDKIVSVSITSEDTQLSGVFGIEFETGALTPYLNPVEEDRMVSIRPNLTLTETAQDLFIPVPAGTYNFKVRLTDIQGHFMEISTTSAKTFTAGEIKAFPEIEFVPTGTQVDVIITSATDLVQFATDWNNKRWTNVVAILTNDIVFDAESSAAFNATGGIGLKSGTNGSEDLYFNGTFDGNGKTISGLTATVPLFVATQDGGGIIKDLTLDNTCSFTFTHPNNGQQFYGSMVGYHRGIMQNVTVNANVAMAAGSFTQITALGGLCGRTVVGSVEDCAYNGNISVPAGFETTKTTYAGGICGYITNAAGVIRNTAFGGTLDFAGKVANTSTTPTLLVGGIVGANNGGTLEGCTVAEHATGLTRTISDDVAVNNDEGSDVTTVKVTICAEPVTGVATLAVGGIVGNNSVAGEVLGKVQDCDNNASILADLIRPSTKDTPCLYFGGIAGMNAGEIVSSYNAGTLNSATDIYNQRFGGIVGSNTAKISSCKNNGSDMFVFGNNKETGGIGSYNVAFGGIIGENKADAVVSDVQNGANITVYRIANNAKTILALGGVAGISEAEIDGSLNGGTISNSGTMYEYNNNSKSTTKGFFHGGIVGWAKASVKNVTNSGKMHFQQPRAYAIAVTMGGVVGLLEAEGSVGLLKCNNSGEVLLQLGYSGAQTTAAKDNRIGGILGSSPSSVAIEDCDNSGYVHTSGNATITDCAYYLGGIAGYLAGASSMKDCDNTGYTYIDQGNNTDNDVTKIFADGGIAGVVQGTAENRISISNCTWINTAVEKVGSRRGTCAGIAAYAEYADVSDCEVNVTYNYYNHVTAGIVGWAENATVSACSFKGSKITATQGYWSGGIVGKLKSGSVVDGCYNYCKDITAPKATTVVGEIAAESEAGTVIKNCHHTGTIPVCTDGLYTDDGSNVADL